MTGKGMPAESPIVGRRHRRVSLPYSPARPGHPRTNGAARMAGTGPAMTVPAMTMRARHGRYGRATITVRTA